MSVELKKLDDLVNQVDYAKLDWPDAAPWVQAKILLALAESAERIANSLEAMHEANENHRPF